jgi:hypothetical protein
LIHLYGPLPALKLRKARVVAATGGDKKNVGGVRRFVLPVGIGDAGVVEDVTAAELEAAVSYMLGRAGRCTPDAGDRRQAARRAPTKPARLRLCGRCSTQLLRAMTC